VSGRRDRELGRRLAELRAPDELEAEHRSWEVVRAAHAARTPLHPSPRNRRLLIAIAAGAVALAIGLSPAGAKVADLVDDVVGSGEPDAKPQLRSLPAAGELLVQSKQGPWIVREDGSKRLLGDYDAASWSPHGVYVVVAQGRELAAVDTEGNPRWTFPTPGVVRDPRWAGDSADTRIAYRSGDDLRVIAGDGSPDSDHLIARDVAPVAPAWRPIGYSKLGPPAANGFVLSYVDHQGRVRTVNTDMGTEVPTKRSDLERLSTPPTGGDRERATSPDGAQVATLDFVRGRTRVLISDGTTKRELFSARGDLTGPAWSPDSRWLLVGWPAADQWLFIDTQRPRHVKPFERISEQFGGGFPGVSGWILPER
jgi:hypothetical protein